MMCCVHFCRDIDRWLNQEPVKGLQAPLHSHSNVVQFWAARVKLALTSQGCLVQKSLAYGNGI